MSQQPLFSDSESRPPIYDDGGQEAAMTAIAERARARRLRNLLFLANGVAWIVIIALAKWLFF